MSDDTSKITLGGAWRPGWLAWCLWTMLILIVTFVLSSEAQVENVVSDAGDQTRDVTSVLSSEDQVNDGALESGDQALLRELRVRP